MADPGCDFEDEDGIECGRKPTQMLTPGMTPPEVGAGLSGWAGVFQYGHFCDKHLPEMQRRLDERED